MEEHAEPKLPTDATGGGGSRGNVRIDAKTPDDEGGDGVRPKKTLTRL